MAAVQMPRLLIETLAPHHDRAGFSCGDQALDHYLIHQAGQDSRKHVTAAFVLVEVGHPEVCGFYTLSATSLQLTDLPDAVIKKLPKYPLVPAILLGRLAVNLPKRELGYGLLLLMDALKRCIDTQAIGWTAVVVDAKNEQAAAFYAYHQFMRFSPNSLRLFLPRSTIAALF